MVLGTCSPLAFVLNYGNDTSVWCAYYFWISPKSMQIWLLQWFLFLRSHHFGTSRTLRKSNAWRFSGCFLVTFLVHQFGRNSGVTLGRGGASKKKWVVFGVFWGEGQMIQISLNSTDGNLDSNYMYIIFVYIHIQKIFRWIVGQRSRNAVALCLNFAGFLLRELRRGTSAHLCSGIAGPLLPSHLVHRQLLDAEHQSKSW